MSSHALDGIVPFTELDRLMSQYCPGGPPPTVLPQQQSGGSASTAQVLGPSDLLDSLLAAQTALQRPDCGSLFNVSGKGPDPATLLRVLFELNMIEFGQINAGATTDMDGPPMFASDPWAYLNQNSDRVQAPRVKITLDSQSWLISSSQWKIETLLHELGHAMNELIGGGGSKVIQDTDPITGDVEDAAEGFNHEVLKPCL
jgi:hypothetical protein